jgi:hypothetical protein
LLGQSKPKDRVIGLGSSTSEPLIPTDKAVVN